MLAALLPLGLSASAAAGRALVTAVVGLVGDRPLTVPGVELVTNLPGVHSEIVRGTPAALADLATRPGVAGLTPDRPVHVASRPEQEPTPTGVRAPATLGAPAGDPGAGHGVTVAVIDTGVSDTPALNRQSGRLVDGVDTSWLVHGGTPVDSEPYTDGYGHGTYVASILAGGPVASGGPVGIAPGATVDVVKVATDQGRASLASVVAGLNWVASNSEDIQIANLSLSVDPPVGGVYGADPLNIAVEAVRDAGVLVVAASGNTAGVVSDPGFDPRALTVGAADTTGSVPEVASFSGSGTVYDDGNGDPVTKPDVVAAGVHLLGLVPADSFVARQNRKATSPVDGTTDLIPGSGTSGATALVAGLAAVVAADHSGASAAQLKATVRDAAHPEAVSGQGAGEGLVDAVPAGLSDGANTGEGDFTPTSEQWQETASLWPDEFWADDLWTTDTRSWSTRSWSTRSWSTRSWSTRSWSTRSWSTRSWSTRSWSTRSWSTRSWSTRSWSVQGWGDAE